VTRHPACRVTLALVVAALLLADLGPGLWHAPGATAQTAAPYHWARKRPHFRLRVGNNVKGDWNRYLRGALDEWNQNDTVTLIEVDGSTNPQYCDPVSGTVQVCDWWYGTQTGWLGLTRIYFNARGDHIDAATVMLNNSFMYAPNSRYNSDAARRHTLCHELGHTLGLDHLDSTSCVNDSQYAVFNYLTPTNGDFRQLSRIYEHEDATTTVTRAQDADLNLFDSTSWPAESEEDVMALPLDEETQVLTFVIWADETALAAETSTEALPGTPGLDPATVDGDGDGVADEDELALYRTNPSLADSDGDGALDGEELFGRYTDPLLWDEGNADLLAPVSDAGALLAGMTAATGTDLDLDNYPDDAELTVGLDPATPDTDGDGVADGDETPLYGTDPLRGDTDGDGLSDGDELFATGTDPLRWDTDGDGVSDGATAPG
jgi:hypothetical protein